MKVYSFILCLFLVVSSKAQQHSISINYKPSLAFFGKQSQNFKNSYFASRKGNTTFRSSGNILYSYKLSPAISITTGLEYSQQGQNISFNADSALPSYNRQILEIELNYVRIPFIVGYSILKLKKAELTIYSGINMGLATKRKDNYQNIILENILLPPAEKRYKNIDWAVPVGTNFQIALSSKLFATIGAEYLIGITNAFLENKYSQFGVLAEFDNSKQRRLSLNIGIVFTSKNKTAL